MHLSVTDLKIQTDDRDKFGVGGGVLCMMCYRWSEAKKVDVMDINKQLCSSFAV